MPTRTLSTITTSLGLNNSAFKKGLNNSKKDVNKFGTSMAKLGATIGGVFALRRIIQFGTEVSKLAAQAEGVSIAFERIRPSLGFLEDLKKATAGTVSELDLMRRSVMASNFKIPLSQLASLFEFATKRAQDTGESVEYLVNSIVIGIGRKSPLILDNLGISAVKLREKLDNVGHSGATVYQVAKAVGEIAQEEMAKAGPIIETTAIKYERLAAEVVDLKVELGWFVNQGLKPTLDFLIKIGEQAKIIADVFRGGIFYGGFDYAHQERIQGEFEKGFTSLVENRKKVLENMAAKDIEGGLFGGTEQAQLIRLVNREIVKLYYELGRLDPAQADQIKNTEAWIQALKDWLKEMTEVIYGPNSLEAMNAELKEMEDAFNKMDVKTEKWYELKDAIEQLKKEIKELTDGLPELTKITQILEAPDLRGFMDYKTTGKGWNWWVAQQTERVYPGGWKQFEGVQEYAETIDELFDDWDEGLEEAGSELEEMVLPLKKMTYLMDQINKQQDKLDEKYAQRVFNASDFWGISLSDAQETIDTVDQLKTAIGTELAQAFSDLAQEAGRALAGVETDLAQLGITLLENMGYILIMAGFKLLGSNPELGAALILAGAGMQLNVGLFKGLREMKGGGSDSGSVEFRIRGNDLVGVLDNKLNKTYMVT